jgi:carboxymethylenebutenolidase
LYAVRQFHQTFQSGGKQIGLDCFVPEGKGKKFPAVLGLHGSGGGHDGMAQPATMLAEHGFAVYVLHYFDRTGTTRVQDRGEILRRSPFWMKTVWDSVSFVACQPGVDAERIGFLGFSLGAYLALADAVIDSRIKAVVEFFGGLPREIRPFVRRLCPVLILHGEIDQTVPVGEAYDLQRVLENKGIPHETKIYPGVGHSFNGEVWRDAGLRSLAFLQKYLAG